MKQRKELLYDVHVKAMVPQASVLGPTLFAHNLKEQQL